MNVGSLEIRLALRGSYSLKDKRRVVKSIKDRLRHRFNISVAEVGDQDHRQAAMLGVAAVSGDSRYLLGQLAKVETFLRRHPEAEVIEATIEML